MIFALFLVHYPLPFLFKVTEVNVSHNLLSDIRPIAIQKSTVRFEPTTTIPLFMPSET
jgi:hypothetical protein